ncbi:MAG: methionine/alanine import family NSS transporter small subunit [Acinetobacter sp.]|jgi:hypothetical protein
MNTSAIVMMMISMVFLWGGLILSILHLMKHPEELDEVLEEVKDHHTL